MNAIAETEQTPQSTPRLAPGQQPFAYRRDYGGNRLVYLTMSLHALGLSIGVNLNQDKRCNFDCVYCEVDRRGSVSDSALGRADLAGADLFCHETYRESAMRALASAHSFPYCADSAKQNWSGLNVEIF